MTICALNRSPAKTSPGASQIPAATRPTHPGTLQPCRHFVDVVTISDRSPCLRSGHHVYKDNRSD